MMSNKVIIMTKLKETEEAGVWDVSLRVKKQALNSLSLSPGDIEAI